MKRTTVLNVQIKTSHVCYFKLIGQFDLIWLVFIVTINYTLVLVVVHWQSHSHLGSDPDKPNSNKSSHFSSTMTMNNETLQSVNSKASTTSAGSVRAEQYGQNVVKSNAKTLK